MAYSFPGLRSGFGPHHQDQEGCLAILYLVNGHWSSSKNMQTKQTFILSYGRLCILRASFGNQTNKQPVLQTHTCPMNSGTSEKQKPHNTSYRTDHGLLKTSIDICMNWYKDRCIAD